MRSSFTLRNKRAKVGLITSISVMKVFAVLMECPSQDSKVLVMILSLQSLMQWAMDNKAKDLK